MELYARVRRAVVVDKMSEREAAKQFGLARETVRKMLRYAVPPGYRRQQPARRPKLDAWVAEVVVNMDRLEEEVAPHAQGVDVALAAFGVGKGSAKMPEEEVRKIEIAYPQAFCRVAKAGGARVCGVMTATGADPSSARRKRPSSPSSSTS